MNKQAVPKKYSLSSSHQLTDSLTEANASRKNSLELRMDGEIALRKNSVAATACEGKVTAKNHCNGN